MPVRARLRGQAGGFTLVELLVAAAMALVVMGALATLLGRIGRAVNDSRDLVQLAARMRSAAWRLRQDLQGATSEVKPYVRPDAACGYLEIVEGPLADSSASLVADVDDLLMLTTTSQGRPFTGMLSGTVGFESPVAEVAWFCKPGPLGADNIRRYNLYRRQLLVAAAPGVAGLATSSTMAFTAWDTLFSGSTTATDLSMRLEGTVLIANSLADLTRRQSRFMHNAAGTVGLTARATWPAINTGTSTSTNGELLTAARQGEDLLLSDVVAFDVRVFDPQQAGGGSYVDLGRGNTSVLTYNTAMAVPPFYSPITFTGMPAGTCVYDTWSLHTECNAIQDSTALGSLDRATNLADDNANGVVDDLGELEMPAPYAVPLRGVEIRIRCYDPSSKEVRQITIQHSFLNR